MKIILVSILILSLFGCGEPTFDASSDEARSESYKVMMEKLSMPEEKKAFEMAFGSVYLSGVLAIIDNDIPTEEEKREVEAKMNGKTAKEIIAMAKEL